MPQHLGPQGTVRDKWSRCREGWGLGAVYMVEVERVSRVQAGRQGRLASVGLCRDWSLKKRKERKVA